MAARIERLLPMWRDNHAMTDSTLPVGQALELHALVAATEHGIASRVLAKLSGGSVTLFSFDAGEGLSEHTSPFEALSIVLEGSFSLTVGGTAVTAQSGTIVRLPATIPHAVEALTPSRMLLVMLREILPRGSE